MIPVSLNCARFVTLCLKDLKREESWLLAAESVSGSVTSLRARSRSTSSFVAERGLCEAMLGLVEGGAGVVDRDCEEL